MDIALGSDRQKANTSSDNAIVYTPSGALVMGSHHETVDPQPELVNQLMTQWAAEFDHMDDFYGQLAKAALDNADQKAQFDSQMAKAMLDASHMKVGPQLKVRPCNLYRHYASCTYVHNPAACALVPVSCDFHCCMQTRLPLRSHSRLANFLCYIQDPSSYTALPIFFRLPLTS